MLRRMRSIKPPGRRRVALPLSLCVLVASSATIAGCKKAEELAGKVSGDEENKDESAD